MKARKNRHGGIWKTTQERCKPWEKERRISTKEKARAKATIGMAKVHGKELERARRKEVDRPNATHVDKRGISLESVCQESVTRAEAEDTSPNNVPVKAKAKEGKEKE